MSRGSIIKEVKIIRTSDKAVFVDPVDDSDVAWLPRSQLGDMANYDFTKGEILELEIPGWLAAKLGWS